MRSNYQKSAALAILIILFWLGMAHSVEKRVFTLEDALLCAIRNNQELQIATEEIAISKARITEARAMILPKIDFNFTASQYEATRPFMLFDTFGSVYYRESPNNTFYVARFSAYQYLYAGGKATSNMKLAKTNLLAAEANREIILSRIKMSVKKAFYELLYAEEKQKLYESEINELTSRKNRLNGKYREWLQELKQEFFNIKANREKSRLIFLAAIGMELDTSFELKGSLAIDLKNYDVNKLLAQAFQYRQELNKIAIQESIDALSVSLLQTERFPTIILGGTYEFQDVNLPDSKKNWAMYLNLNLPVFDGWASWARLSAKKSQLSQSKKKKIELEDAVRLEVKTAFINYITSKEKLEQDKKILKENITIADRKKVFALKLNVLDSQLSAALNHAILEKSVGRDLN